MDREGGASTNDRVWRLQDREEDAYEMDADEAEEVEIEEVVDEEPMHITGRLFLGSLDAARNLTALQRLRIRETLALLGQNEEKTAVSSDSNALATRYAEQQINRTLVEMEDSKDGELLLRIPGILAALGTIM